jgi:hypothetical protein
MIRPQGQVELQLLDGLLRQVEETHAVAGLAVADAARPDDLAQGRKEGSSSPGASRKVS